MKVLLSAYACAPGYGSEPEVGLQTLLAAAEEHEVWVLTQPHMADALTPYLAVQHPQAKIHVVGLHPRAPVRQAGLPALAVTQLRHEQWQRAAGRMAEQLHAEVRFDLVHHVTLAAYWMRTGVADVAAPLVWGPVGGAVEPPWRLIPELGVRGAVEDAVRAVVRMGFWQRPSVRRAARRATVTLVQNDDTARRVRADARAVRVLPNALCTRVPALAPAGGRRPEIAVVGRVVAWKAVPLALHALSMISDKAVVLRVYGEAGSAQERRVQRAAARFGVQDRVELMGKVPREDLLEVVASSSAVLHPSLHDEASLTIAEALSLGTPVVALAHGGPAHVASHWPQHLVRLVPPAGPRLTATRLAAALDEVLDVSRPRPDRPLQPDVDFRTAILQAYEQARRAHPQPS